MNFTLVKGHHHFFSIVVCSISIYDMIGEPVEKTPHTHTHTGMASVFSVGKSLREKGSRSQHQLEAKQKT